MQDPTGVEGIAGAALVAYLGIGVGVELEGILGPELVHEWIGKLVRGGGGRGGRGGRN